MSKEIIVVGGGAAGMMAAIAAGEQGASVKLLEPNERLGKKLNITGKGRCNVTNHADLGNSAGQYTTEREVPLQCHFPLRLPGHHGIF